jgi:hypothetical protein
MVERLLHKKMLKKREKEAIEKLISNKELSKSEMKNIITLIDLKLLSEEEKKAIEKLLGNDVLLKTERQNIEILLDKDLLSQEEKGKISKYYDPDSRKEKIKDEEKLLNIIANLYAKYNSRFNSGWERTIININDHDLDDSGEFDDNESTNDNESTSGYYDPEKRFFFFFLEEYNNNNMKAAKNIFKSAQRNAFQRYFGIPKYSQFTNDINKLGYKTINNYLSPYKRGLHLDSVMKTMIFYLYCGENQNAISKEEIKKFRKNIKTVVKEYPSTFAVRLKEYFISIGVDISGKEGFEMYKELIESFLEDSLDNVKVN